jgi:hypothetical protein
MVTRIQKVKFNITTQQMEVCDNLIDLFVDFIIELIFNFQFSDVVAIPTDDDNIITAGWFIGLLLALIFLLLLLCIICIVRRNRGGKYDVQDREMANGRHDYPDEAGFHEYSQP